MNDLQNTDKTVLNNLTDVHNLTTKFGNKVQEIITSLSKAGTPVNAVAATEILNVSGVPIHGETIMINNPAKEGTDTYEFAADDALTVTAPANIPIDISSYATKATGALTMDAQPIAGDTVTIGTKVYTFVPVGTDTADGEVTIAADLAGAQAALLMAISGDGLSVPHTLVSVVEWIVNVLTITAKIGGTLANAIPTTSIFTAGTNGFAAVTLGGGTNCSAANGTLAIVATIVASDTQDVDAAKGTGNTIVLTADEAGVSGNAVILAEAMANGNFIADSTELSGGTDGTVSDGLKILADTTYLYVTPVANTKAGKNWRRIAIGNVY